MSDNTQDAVMVGKVSSVQEDGKKARVVFMDAGHMVSGPLLITSTTGTWQPQVGEMVLCLFLPRGEGDGFIVGRVWNG